MTGRARLIKPGFFSNEDLSALPIEARLLFIGLWTLADRLGRLEDRPRRIKADLFPYEVNLGSAEATPRHSLGSAEGVDILLDVLGDAGFIVRYEADDKGYIQVVSFLKHQSPHVREAVSVIPGIYEGKPKASLGDAKATPRSPVAVPVPVAETVPVAVAVTTGACAPDLLPPVLAAWESATGQLAPRMTAEGMDHWIEKAGQQWVLDAIAETNANGAKAWKYTTSILERWEREGRDVVRGGQNGRTGTRAISDVERADRAATDAYIRELQAAE